VDALEHPVFKRFNISQPQPNLNIIRKKSSIMLEGGNGLLAPMKCDSLPNKEEEGQKIWDVGFNKNMASGDNLVVTQESSAMKVPRSKIAKKLGIQRTFHSVSLKRGHLHHDSEEESDNDDPFEEEKSEAPPVKIDLKIL